MHNSRDDSAPDDFLYCLFEQAVDGIVLLDQTYAIKAVNTIAHQQLGYGKGEMLGKSIYSFVAPEYAPGLPAGSSDAHERGKSFYESAMVRKDGSTLPVEIGQRAIAHGSATVLLLWIRDISMRPRQEAILQDKEAKLVLEIARRTKVEQAVRDVAKLLSHKTGRSFITTLAEGLAKLFEADYAFIGVLDEQNPSIVNTISVYAHGQHVENISYSLENTPCANVVGWKTCVHPDKVTALYPEDKLLQDMGVYNYIGSPMFDADGKPQGLIVVLNARDLLEIAMAEEILEIFADRAAAEIQRLRDEQQLRIAAAAFEARVGFMITDGHDRILRANHAFFEIAGYCAIEVIGNSPVMFRSDRHDSGFYREMRESVSKTGKWEGELWGRRKDGEDCPVSLTIARVSDADRGHTNYVYTCIDITSRKRAEEEIRQLAFFDPLTQLPNRRLLLDRLNQALASSKRGGWTGALLFIDLDNFKSLNDLFGHDAGDALLLKVTQSLRVCVRESDTVARLGGDEFVVLLAGLSEKTSEAAAQAKAVGDEILSVLNRAHDVGNETHLCTASIGIALFSGAGQTAKELMKQADVAMYRAKNRGRNSLCFFDRALQSNMGGKLTSTSPSI